MSNDLKQESTITITQDEYELIMAAMEEKYKKHRGLAVSIGNSGYQKATTLDKAEWHRNQAEYVRLLMSKIAESFT